MAAPAGPRAVLGRLCLCLAAFTSRGSLAPEAFAAAPETVAVGRESQRGRTSHLGSGTGSGRVWTSVTCVCSGPRDTAVVQDFSSECSVPLTVMLGRQMLYVLLAAKPLLLAFLLWKAVFLRPVRLASTLLPFFLTNADLPRMPVIVSPADPPLIFSPRSSLGVSCLSFSRLSGAAADPAGVAQVWQQDLWLRPWVSGRDVPSSVHPALVSQLVLGC